MIINKFNTVDSYWNPHHLTMTLAMVDTPDTMDDVAHYWGEPDPVPHHQGMMKLSHFQLHYLLKKTKKIQFTKLFHSFTIAKSYHIIMMKIYLVQSLT